MYDLTPDGATTMSWINEYLEAWSSHDADAVIGYMTHDVVFTDLGLGERLEGTDAVKNFIYSQELNFSTDYRFTLEQEIITDTACSFEWTMSGTNDRVHTARGLPATGAHFEVHGISFGVLQEGKIKDIRLYWNLTEYLMQVGLMPTPGAPGQGQMPLSLS